MRSTWPFLAATVAIGLGLGTWIAGFPTSEGSISVAEDATPGSILPIPIDPSNTVPIGPTSSLPPITVTPTTVPPRQPVPSTDETTPPTTAAPTTVAATTAAPTTAAPTTVADTAPATTAPADTAPPDTAAPMLDRSQVRLVVANGDGRWNLVGANVARLEPLGYTEIDQTDVGRRYDRTILYVRPGFEDEAARLAADLLVPGALVEPLPAEPVTINDQLGDIVVVLGPDAVR